MYSNVGIGEKNSFLGLNPYKIASTKEIHKFFAIFF